MSPAVPTPARAGHAPHARIEEVFRALSLEVFAFASKLPAGRISAHDLVQEAFIAAYRDWPRFGALPEAQQLRWLKTVVRRRSIDSYRRHAREFQLPEYLAERGGDAAEDLAHRIDQVLAQRCWRIVEEMPPVRRQVAHLAWWEQTSTAQIAQLLDITESTVRGHVKLARDEILDQFGAPAVPVDDAEQAAGPGSPREAALVGAPVRSLRTARLQVGRDLDRPEAADER